MARVLLDTCVPRRMLKALSGHQASTAQQLGLDNIPDNRLLDAIDGAFDALITRDRNLPHQQNLAGRSMSIIILRVREQTPEAFDALIPLLQAALKVLRPGEVHEIGPL